MSAASARGSEEEEEGEPEEHGRVEEVEDDLDGDDDDDEDLLIDLGHGFGSERERETHAHVGLQETEGTGKAGRGDAATTDIDVDSFPSTSPTLPTCATAADVIDLISPEPHRAATTTAPARKHQASVTIDLCSSSLSEEPQTPRRTRPNVLDKDKMAQVRKESAKKKKRPVPPKSPPAKRARSESTKAAASQRASQREAEKAAKQTRNLAIKRKRGDFALDEVTVLISTQAVEDSNSSTGGVGLKICEAVGAKGMKYEVRSDLLAGRDKKVPAIFWKTSYFEAKPNAMIPCAAIVLQASDFINHLDDGIRFDDSFRELLSSGSGLPEHRKKLLKLYCVVIGWERELETREKKSTIFSPIRYEQKIAELIVQTRGLQVHKVTDAREAAEYVSTLSMELARLPYRSDETLGDMSKKVPIIFRGNERSDQKRAWINCIHQLPQIGVKVAESIAEAFDSFGKLMASYTSSLLPLSERRQLVQGLVASDKGRCVGPSLSNKLFEFFNSTGGDNAI